ncbi:hypothetical protein D3C78_839510 [compost metagenome]
MRGRQGVAAHARHAEQQVQHGFQPQLLDEPHGHAALRQQQGPGVGLDDVAGPHRHHHRDVEERLGLARGVARHVVGDREGQRPGGDGHGDGHGHGAQDDVVVGRVEQGGEVRPGQVRRHRHGEVVEGVEALPQQGQQRPEIDRAEPQQRRYQQQREVQRRLAVEQVGQAAQRTAGCLRPFGLESQFHVRRPRAGPPWLRVPSGR